MGKVHGSLARAGKVKSQTPKVRPSSASTSVEEAGRTPRREDDWVAKQRLIELYDLNGYRELEKWDQGWSDGIQQSAMRTNR